MRDREIEDISTCLWKAMGSALTEYGKSHSEVDSRRWYALKRIDDLFRAEIRDGNLPAPLTDQRP